MLPPPFPCAMMYHPGTKEEQCQLGAVLCKRPFCNRIQLQHDPLNEVRLPVRVSEAVAKHTHQKPPNGDKI